MTIQELITELNKSEDKNREVYISVHTEIADDFVLKDTGDAVYLVG